ncbi:MAG: type III-B CRISPR module RAMP protein Cmr1 [Deltaproteobacteria bacterium]|nr:MAG: type III-B CRISPR module RAMP protein Cmr1 [Deltaproteobacteria bacterium]
MKQIRATFQVVTPMFLGDGHLHFSGIRAPSIKGALRYWWRALHWEAVRKQAGSDEEALKRLHKAESWLLGNAAGTYPASNGKKPNVGQSRVLLSVWQPENWDTLIEDKWPSQPRSQHNIDGSSYMGFGLFEMRRKGGQVTHPQRQALHEGVTFGLVLTFKPDLETGKKDCWRNELGDPVNSVRKALVWWGLVGGLGSRSRRGFGSVALRTLEEDEQTRDFTYDTPEAYEKQIRQTLKDYSRKALPPFTALSGETQFAFLSNPLSDPRDAIDVMGDKYKTYRTSLKRYERVPFGLPLANENTNDRRAGPLFFHVHPVGRRYVSSVLFVPAVFHPHISKGNHIDFYRNVQAFLKKNKGS